VFSDSKGTNGVRPEIHVMQIMYCNQGFVSGYFGILMGARQRSWLRHHATDRMVTGQIPDDVTRSFN
jgi:hypothetical protein